MTSKLFILNEAPYGSERSCNVLRLEIRKQRATDNEEKHE